MSTTGSALRELHRIHKQLTDLRSRLDRGPKQVAASEGAVRRMELDAEQAKEAHKKARIASDEKQLQLKSREARIEDLKSKLNQASSNKEFQTLKDQIAADQQANSVLEDEILESLERIDILAAKVKKAEADLANAKTEGGKVKTRVDSEQAGLESELARVLSELKDAEGNLPSDYKQDYARVARVRGEEAARRSRRRSLRRLLPDADAQHDERAVLGKAGVLQELWCVAVSCGRSRGW